VLLFIILIQLILLKYHAMNTYEGLHVLYYGSAALLFGSSRFLSFLMLCVVGTNPWTEDQPVARRLPTHRTLQTEHLQTDIYVTSGI
jgi:hypothetical protein